MTAETIRREITKREQEIAALESGDVHKHHSFEELHSGSGWAKWKPWLIPDATMAQRTQWRITFLRATIQAFQERLQGETTR